MKKSLIALFLAVAGLTAALPAHAVTWWNNGVLYGNVCRNGAYYTIYPTYNGQPVGTSCPIRNNGGWIVGYGTVSDE